MDNRVLFKKMLKKIAMVFILFIIVILLVNNYFYKENIKEYNIKISNLTHLLESKNISKNEIANILNNDNVDLSYYGIDENEEIPSKVKTNEKRKRIILLCSLVMLNIIIIYIIYKNEKDKKIKIDNITYMLKMINNGIYDIDFSSKDEDELSILKDNIYKITYLLKEEKEKSLKDKEHLKENLENISHQIKTPLTAISIIADNLLENKNINDKKRYEFLINLKREIVNVNTLIKNLLNLSRLDIKAIEFNKKSVNIYSILKECVKNVELLIDIKNIEIKISGDDFNIFCDAFWQEEALTNILKNAVENSDPNLEVYITLKENNAYKMISFKNKGHISDDDIKNIFKRFYACSCVKESTGIGLSLANEIIKNDNGKIFVKNVGDYVLFEVKYYKVYDK